MIRKLTISVAAAMLLAGCVTSDYAHRQGGRGDYYYGHPTTEYRYQGYSPYGYSPYGGYGGHRYGYGYPYYGAYPGHYGYPYRPGYPVYPGYPYRPHHPHHPRPPVVVHPNPPPPGEEPDNDRRPNWRDLDEVGRRARNGSAPMRYEPAAPQIAQPGNVQSRQPPPARLIAPRPQPQPRVQAPRADSAVSSRIQQARESRSSDGTVEP
ncbi:MAG: hypothetical protein M3Q40_06510 [Pseudomonadota bacterium]|nr:hypothetical protein [Pseudomonadota bacterium]